MSYQVTEYSNINGACVVTRNFPDMPTFWSNEDCVYFFNYDAFNNDDCTNLDFSDTQCVGVNVFCDVNGRFTVLLSNGDQAAFFATGVPLSISTDNQIGCLDSIVDPHFPFTLHGIAQLGNVTITL